MSQSQLGAKIVGGEPRGWNAPHNSAPTNEFDIHIPNNHVLNSNQRLNTFVKATHTKYIRKVSHATATNWGFEPMYIAHVVVYISFQDERRRDIGNLYPSCKAAIDGFVDAGVITDDDHTKLIGPDMRLGGKSQKGFTTFHFELREVA